MSIESIPSNGRGTPERSRKNYLTDGYGIWSWLLTTDHKRIALLYLISVTAFFFVGGSAATLLRLGGDVSGDFGESHSELGYGVGIGP